MPTQQVRLLELWDEIGLSHDSPKKLWDTVLPLIRVDVDPNAMTATLPPDAKTRLLGEIAQFCDPRLCNVYAKMLNKSRVHAGIFVNSAIIHDLQWMARHIEQSDDWGPDDVMKEDPSHECAFVDASGLGLGLYFLWQKLGFWSNLPAIFWFEALAACSAVHVAAFNLSPRIARFTLFFDNTNTVTLFDTLHALSAYNSIAKSVVDALLAEDMQLQVGHVSGKTNGVVDALSRQCFDVVQVLVPDITILPFSPPRDALGADKK
ncbi:hypothetical protein BKA93DRAFT_815891 [Sparassis latifolia]